MVAQRNVEVGSGGADRSPFAPAPGTGADVEPTVETDDGIAGLARVVRRHYGRPLQVLLVTDDEDSAAAFADAAEESVLDVGIEVTADVDEAVAHVQKALGSRRRRGVPDVVVTAVEVDESHRLLEELRAQTEADAFPVIVLSDDPLPSQERRSFALGAAVHLRAPDRQYQRVALIHALPDFLPQFRS